CLRRLQKPKDAPIGVNYLRDPANSLNLHFWLGDPSTAPLYSCNGEVYVRNLECAHKSVDRGLCRGRFSLSTQDPANHPLLVAWGFGYKPVPVGTRPLFDTPSKNILIEIYQSHRV